MDINVCIEAGRRERIYEETCKLYKKTMGLKDIPKDVEKMIEKEVREGRTSPEGIFITVMEKTYR